MWRYFKNKQQKRKKSITIPFAEIKNTGIQKKIVFYKNSYQQKSISLTTIAWQ